MADITQQVAELKTQADEATAARHRAEAELAAAADRAQAARARLQEEFKVGTVAEARDKEKRMETALENEVARVRGLLAQAGGEL